MNERLTVSGMVLSSAPAGEHDRRVVLLTKELGRISAFAKGASKPKSSMSAGSRPFSAGSFELIRGRGSYTLVGMKISRYFDRLAQDPEKVCYGMYVMEFAAYYSREGIGAADLLNLCWLTLDALEKESHPAALIRGVFELRAMQSAGEYSPEPLGSTQEGAAEAWRHVIQAPLERLYAFRLSSGAAADFLAAVERLKAIYIDRPFHSLEVLEQMR